MAQALVDRDGQKSKILTMSPDLRPSAFPNTGKMYKNVSLVRIELLPCLVTESKVDLFR